MNSKFVLIFFIFSILIFFPPHSIAEVQDKNIIVKNVSISDAVLTEGELDLLAKRPLVIGYSSIHQPLSYLKDDDAPRGIIIDIFNLLSKKYGFEIEYKSIDSLKNEAEANKPLQADLILPIVKDESIDYANFVLTDAYLSLPFMIFTLNDTNDQNTFRSKEGYITMYDYLFADMDKISNDFGNKKFKVFRKYGELFFAYNNGEIDALMATDTSTFFAQYIVYKTKQLTQNNHELAIYETEHRLNFFAYLSRNLENYAEYETIFNKMFAGLNQHIINDIKLFESKKFYPDLSILDFLIQHYYTIIAGIIASILLVISLVLLLNNRKKTGILKIANIDKVTGLSSQHKFFTDIRSILKNAKPDEYKYVTVRLDNFSVINDMFSYEKGTQLIIAIAQFFEEKFKEQEILISREKTINFSLFCRSEIFLNTEAICAQDFNKIASDVLSYNYDLKVSIGKYIIDNPKDSVEEISNRVRLAVKKGANSYKNTLTVFDEHMLIAEKMSQDIVFRMRSALARKEFFVVYQPKVDLITMKIIGAEALVRWKPEGSTSPINPDQFVPVFEENGFIAELDLFVFEEVCKFISSNQHMFPLLKISINFSPVTLFTPTSRAKAFNLLTKYKLPPERIIIELTESATLLDQSAVGETLLRVKSDGFEVSIDDFGSGLSSLNRLGNLDVDEIKLDKEFLDFDKEHETKKIFIVQDIVAMIKRLGIRIVCEGIETKGHAMWLSEIGCSIGQGFYFSKPLRKDAFKSILMQPDKSQVLPAKNGNLQNGDGTKKATSYAKPSY